MAEYLYVRIIYENLGRYTCRLINSDGVYQELAVVLDRIMIENTSSSIPIVYLSQKNQAVIPFDRRGVDTYIHDFDGKKISNESHRTVRYLDGVSGAVNLKRNATYAYMHDWRLLRLIKTPDYSMEYVARSVPKPISATWSPEFPSRIIIDYVVDSVEDAKLLPLEVRVKQVFPDVPSISYETSTQSGIQCHKGDTGNCLRITVSGVDVEKKYSITLQHKVPEVESDVSVSIECWTKYEPDPVNELRILKVRF
ncbi:hypothetical protein RB195_001997 [Necator americanus]|uniref:Ig-like domain-containing protein n=1 Tax=Necator americanus TaxID=51031 RepID=A0ABR1DJS9_NECAM